MHFHQNLGRSRLDLHFFLGDLRWNDPVVHVCYYIFSMYMQWSWRAQNQLDPLSLSLSLPLSFTFCITHCQSQAYISLKQLAFA